MVTREAALPLTRAVLAVAFVGCATFTSVVVVAQPASLYDCVATGDDLTSCADVAAGLLSEPSCVNPGEVYLYEVYRGRIAWFPLQYTGPVVIGVTARAPAGTRFPIYIEVIRPEDQPELGHCDGPGLVVMRVQGRPACDHSEEIKVLDLSRWIGPSGTFVIRATFVGDPAVQFQSPYLGCIRVEPVNTGVRDLSWGFLKNLYR